MYNKQRRQLDFIRGAFLGFILAPIKIPMAIMGSSIDTTPGIFSWVPEEKVEYPLWIDKIF